MDKTSQHDIIIPNYLSFSRNGSCQTDCKLSVYLQHKYVIVPVWCNWVKKELECH